jgi:Xaa-Pro aminopeptidase
MGENRLDKVKNLLGKAGLDACTLLGMENIFYLTGFRGSDGMLLVTKGDVLLMTDSRYVTYAREVVKGLVIIEVRGRTNPLSELCNKYGIRRLGFDSSHTTYNVYKRWGESLPNVDLVPLEGEIEDIRARKDPDEIQAIVKAIDVSTDAFRQVFDRIRPGLTEKEVANELDYVMRQLGADQPSFKTIVASGPRAALPHAEPTDKTIERGETVIIDFGAQVDGYCSDETCTIRVGEVSSRLEEIYTVVDQARNKGLEKIKSGTPVKELDMIVRGFIQEAGYGDYFRHGVGHGVGIAVHEAPTINGLGEGLLEENMVVTVEPGVYVPNVGGVRLEDMVLVTEGGPKVLTHLRKDVLRI